MRSQYGDEESIELQEDHLHCAKQRMGSEGPVSRQTYPHGAGRPTFFGETGVFVDAPQGDLDPSIGAGPRYLLFLLSDGPGLWTCNSSRRNISWWTSTARSGFARRGRRPRTCATFRCSMRRKRSSTVTRITPTARRTACCFPYAAIRR